MSSTIRFLSAASLIAVASTAHAQTAERSLLNSLLTVDIAGTHHPTPSFAVDGEQVLLGRVEGRPSQASSALPASLTEAPIDGERALLGRRPSSVTGFHLKLRGAVANSAGGDAEFGVIPSAEPSPSGFVVSLGARGNGSAVLFTRVSGTPLGAGSYRISERGNGADEILALVMTGPASEPSGVFRGRSGRLVVNSASDGLLAGWFEVDAVGFLAGEPRRENRSVSATGSFAATAAGLSSR